MIHYSRLKEDASTLDGVWGVVEYSNEDGAGGE